jgi:dolichyl-phosphate-mannose--protein O-mannosyl transferase
MSRIVYLMGNPIVLWAVLSGVVGFALIRVVALAQRGSAMINFAGISVQASAISRFLSLGTYCFVCYWLNLLPVRALCGVALWFLS